jgi:hypothetical protein
VGDRKKKRFVGRERKAEEEKYMNGESEEENGLW